MRIAADLVDKYNFFSTQKIIDINFRKISKFCIVDIIKFEFYNL